MAVECVFYGGVNDYEKGELGGVQGRFDDLDLNAKWLFECGQRPDHWNEYYGFPYRPKAFQFLSLAERLELYKGLQEVFRRDYQLHRGVDKQPDLDLEMIISHPHFDHVGGIGLMDHRVRTRMHRHAKLMLYIWQILSGRTNNQFVDVIDQFSLVNKSNGEKKFASGMKALLSRNIKTFEDYEEFRIGGVNVRTYPVDHSIPGSCAFIFETSAGNIAVSGDIRFRGGNRELTEKFIDDVVKLDCRYAFWEGSLFHFDHFGTEDDIAREMAYKIKDSTFAGYSAPPRDLARLRSAYRAAEASKRILCVPPDQMTYLKALNGQLGLPKPDDKHIAVLLLPKMKGLLDREDFPEGMMGSDYFYWERQFIGWKKWERSAEKKDTPQIALFENIEERGKPVRARQRVTLDDIRDNQDCFYVNMPASRVPDMLDVIRPAEGSAYIRSHPAPWTKDMEVQEERQVNLLRAYGMNEKAEYPDVLNPPKTGRELTIHITGHFNRFEMREVMERMPSTTRIIAYHCMDPKQYREVVPDHLEVIVPRLGEKLILE